MKRSITIEIDCDEKFCEPCRHANNPENYRYCFVFDERIRTHPNAEAIRCDGCLEAEDNDFGIISKITGIPQSEISDMIRTAARTLVGEGLERLKEGEK